MVMADTIHDVMMPNPLTVDRATPILVAAQMMRENDIGDVLVTENGRLEGILTDRDIVVRGVATGRDLSETAAGECCSSDVQTVAPGDSLDSAVDLMRQHALDDGRPVGIVSIGDLAYERDPHSALADISAARPNT
jgi:CBS domain-containing protein